jgi:hypothetical protein
MTEPYQTAECVADFNEVQWKKFGSRIGDRWSFSLPPHEMQNLEALLPNHVLSAQNIKMGPGAEIILGKLTKKKD